jgi:hypothetical protein
MDVEVSGHEIERSGRQPKSVAGRSNRAPWITRRAAPLAQPVSLPHPGGPWRLG